MGQDRRERERNLRCPAKQVNRKVPDFTCKLKMYHAGPHEDPDTGQRWNHRGLPGFMKKRSSY